MGRASRRQPGDVLRPLPRPTTPAYRIADSYMIPALTLLRTREYGMSPYAAGLLEFQQHQFGDLLSDVRQRAGMAPAPPLYFAGFELNR